MYSILIKVSDTTYQYATNPNGANWAGDVDAAKAKVLELLETYPITRIKVVHNADLTANLSIADVL